MTSPLIVMGTYGDELRTSATSRQDGLFSEGWSRWSPTDCLIFSCCGSEESAAGTSADDKHSRITHKGGRLNLRSRTSKLATGSHSSCEDSICTDQTSKTSDSGELMGVDGKTPKLQENFTQSLEKSHDQKVGHIKTVSRNSQSIKRRKSKKLKEKESNDYQYETRKNHRKSRNPSRRREKSPGLQSSSRDPSRRSKSEQEPTNSIVTWERRILGLRIPFTGKRKSTESVASATVYSSYRKNAAKFPEGKRKVSTELKQTRGRTRGRTRSRDTRSRRSRSSGTRRGPRSTSRVPYKRSELPGIANERVERIKNLPRSRTAT